MMKWQQILAYSGGGTVSIFFLLALIVNLSGMSVSYDGDKLCTDCYSEIRINSTYWEIKVEHSGDKDLIYKKRTRSRTLWLNLDKIEQVVITEPRIKVDVLVPAIKRTSDFKSEEYGYLRQLKDGDTLIHRSSSKRPNPSRIILHANKGITESVKWGFELDSWTMEGIYIDPIWQGIELRLELDGVNESRKYEYQSRINVSANITGEFNDVTVCIDLDAPGYGTNYSCGINKTSFIYNATILRQTNFTKQSEIVEQSTDSYSCEGNFATPCSDGDDGDWGFADSDYFIDVASPYGSWTWYENRTIKVGSSGAEYIFQYRVDGYRVNVSCNEGSNTWNEFFEASSGQELKTLAVPTACTNNPSGKLEIEVHYNQTGGGLLRGKFADSNVSWNGTFTEINITMDNQTIMDAVSFNLSSLSSTENINISYYGNTKRLKGTLYTDYLIDDEFYESGSFKTAVNFTFTEPGSKFIYVNASGLYPLNLSFDLTGFSLDEDNNFTETESFTTTARINKSTSYNTSAPLGMFDDFRLNITDRWTYYDCDSRVPTFSYSSDSLGNYLSTRIADGGGSSWTCKLKYDDPVADMRNTSQIQIMVRPLLSASRTQNADCSGSATFTIYLTDGTKTETIDSIHISRSANPGGTTTYDELYNYSLQATDDTRTSFTIYRNGTNKGTADISDFDFSEQIRFEQSYYAGGGAPPGTCSGASQTYNYRVEWGGAWLAYQSNNGTYAQYGNVSSTIVHTTPNNISIATLSKIDYVPDGTGPLSYYMANDCNSTVPSFEEVTPDIPHTFVAQGSNICWRATLNSSINTTSPLIREVSMTVVEAQIENITIDLGDDGTIDNNFSGILNSSNSPFIVNLTPNNEHMTMKISTDSSGVLMLDNFKLNSSINPIVLEADVFEDCTHCIIDFSFNLNQINVSDVRFDFLGSWNYTATAWLNWSFNTSSTIQLFYSYFNLTHPSGYDYFDVLPSSKDDKNRTAYLEDEDTPIWNFTNLAYDHGIDIFVAFNDTINSRINGTISNNTYIEANFSNSSLVWYNGTIRDIGRQNLVNGSVSVFNLTGSTIHSNNYSVDYATGEITPNSTMFDGTRVYLNYSYYKFTYDLQNPNTFIINTSFQKLIDNISIVEYRAAHSWWNFYNATIGIYIPYMDTVSICEGCVVDYDDFQYYSIIQE